MKIGIYTNAFRESSLEEALKTIRGLGIGSIELGCGEESGFSHLDPAELLSDEGAFAAFTGLLQKYRVGISALSCHGNPVSPDPAVRELSVSSMERAVLLAEKLGLATICCFSGCPGDSEESTRANWITTSWPMDYAEAYRWQWEERLLPFWREFTAFARGHGVSRIALELHPGQCCYNPKTLLRLREACGPEIGVNLDLSHLLWQRMDPILVIRELAGKIYHMHAKDISIDPWAARENGLITTAWFDRPRERSWNFRTVGWGHGQTFWRRVFLELRRCGYDGVASIELECEALSIPDGAAKAVAFLKDCLPGDLSPGEACWLDRTREGRIRRFREQGWTDG